MDVVNITKMALDFVQMVGFPTALVVLVIWYENRRQKEVREESNARYEDLRAIVNSQQILLTNYEQVAKTMQNMVYESRDVHFLAIRHAAEGKETLRNMNVSIEKIEQKLESREICPLQKT